MLDVLLFFLLLIFFSCFNLLQFWEMFNFFASNVKGFGRVKSTLLNQTSEGVFFR